MLLIQAYGTANIYSVNMANLYNPFIIRMLGNVYDNDISNVVQGGPITAYNYRWVIAEVVPF